MLKILVVEDDAEKLRQVVSLLREIPGIDLSKLQEVRSSHQARQILATQVFDVMILDIHLPRHLYEEPRPTEGIQLLEDIREDETYNIPAHVIGLTGIPTVYENVSPLFAADLFAIVLYDQQSEWRSMLRRKLEYIARTAAMGRGGLAEHGHDVAIVTALRQVELDAVRRLPWGWHETRYEGDALNYWHGHLPNRDVQVRVVAVAAPAMGMPSASVTCSRVIERFRPSYLIMAGITAGIKDRVNIGDVICADPTWDWGSGKYVVQDGQPNFLPAPYQIPLDPDMRGKIERIQGNEAALSQISTNWPGTRPDKPLRLHLGPLAEPPRVSRRLFGLSHAAMGVGSSIA